MHSKQTDKDCPTGWASFTMNMNSGWSGRQKCTGGWAGGAVQGLSLALKIGEPCLLQMGQQTEQSQGCCHLGLEEKQSRHGSDNHRHRGRRVHYIPWREAHGLPITLKNGQLTSKGMIPPTSKLPSCLFSISSIIASAKRVPGG